MHWGMNARPIAVRGTDADLPVPTDGRRDRPDDRPFPIGNPGRRLGVDGIDP